MVDFTYAKLIRKLVTPVLSDRVPAKPGDPIHKDFNIPIIDGVADLRVPDLAVYEQAIKKMQIVSLIDSWGTMVTCLDS